MFKLDKYKVESCLRLALATLIATILSIVDIPTVIPPSFNYIVGVAGISFALTLPKAYYTFLMILPVVLSTICLALLSATACIAAATVSDGLFIFVFSIFALMYSGFFFGDLFSATAGLGNLCTLFTGMMAVNFRVLVQDGFSFDITPSLDSYAAAGVEAVDAICAHLQIQNCSTDAIISELNQTLTFVIPGDSMFSGQEATVSLVGTDGVLAVNLDVPGGLWIVKGLWTWSGTQNGLAIFRNLLIAICWALAVFVVVALVPLRTARSTISTELVPNLLRSSIEPMTPLMQLVHTLNALNPGVALYVLFEPRCKAPFQNLKPALTALIDKANRASISLLYLVRTDYEDQELVKSMTVVVEHCASALESSDVTVLESNTLSEHTSSLQEKNLRATGLIDVTREWVDAIRSPRFCLGGKETVESILHVYVTILALPLLPVLRFIQVLLLPFQPKYWHFRKFLWSFKLAAGFVALVSMEVFWPAYANYFIETPQPTAKHHTLSGWQIVTYSATLLATVEGTTKKGITRTLGNALGGFSGWLAVVVCSASTANDAPINPYGFVAWLTITNTVIAYFFAFGPGLQAYLGIDQDHGDIGNYFVATQALVALMVYHGSGGRGEIALNRIVATIIGSLTSVFVSLIPPYVRGGNPAYVRAYYESTRDAYLAFLRALIKEADRTDDDQEAVQFDDDYKKNLGKEMKKERSYASWLLKDAGRLTCLPFMRVDERIRPAIEKLTLLESLLLLCVDLAQDDNTSIKHIKPQLEEALVVWENDREIPGVSKSSPSSQGADEAAMHKSLETESLGQCMSRFSSSLKNVEDDILAIGQDYDDTSYLRHILNKLPDLNLSGDPYDEHAFVEHLASSLSSGKKTE